MRGRTLKIKNITISLSALLWLSILVVLTFTGVYIAKYRTEMKKESEMISANFHFSSDYLEEPSGLLGTIKEYEIYDWQEGFEIELYNYEKENIRSVAADDITYTIDCDNANYALVVGTEQTLTAGSSAVQKIKITPSTGTTVTVEATSTSPFEKTLKAKFKLMGQAEAEMTAVKKNDNGNYYLVTIKSNGYSGNISLTYDEALIPDTTNPYMRNWVRGTSADGLMTLEAYKTYELIFFNPTNEIYSFTME